MYKRQQVWLNDIVVGGQQENQAVEQSKTWERGEAVAPAPVDRPDPGDPIIMASAPQDDVQFANLIIPRFGDGWTRPILGGIAVNGALADGIGHYPDTALPGEIGNFALAGHRTTFGRPLHDIDRLADGDLVVVETAATVHVYEVASREIVFPSDVEVIAPVPSDAGAAPTAAVLTLTSCHPKFSATQRFVVHANLVESVPRAEWDPSRPQEGQG